jgi:hypothetical protein
VPTLNALQIAERLGLQLEKLQRGQEVAIRDLRALLTSQQHAEMDVAWKHQQALRKRTRARTEEQQQAQGWRTKRQVQISAVQQALAEYDANVLEDVNKLLQDKELRQAKIFLREFFNAHKDGKDFWSAWVWANNELVRAGLNRVDGQTSNLVSSRDKEVREMEEQILEQILEQIRSKMTAQEREQLREQDDLALEYDKSSNKKKRN